jgi:hypothetical protein
VVQADGATLSASGRMLGPDQDAKLRLDALRLEVFQPLIEAALPRLSASSPDVAQGKAQSPISRPLNKLQAQMRRAAEAFVVPPGGPVATSALVEPAAPPAPVRGLSLGAVRLAEAHASASLARDGFVRLDAALAPTGAHGSVTASCAAHATTGAALDAHLDVKDAGMRILAELCGRPAAWVDGRATVSVRATGSAAEPKVAAAAQLSRARLHVPYLKEPLLNVEADATLTDDVLRVRALQATSGPASELRMQGVLPMYPNEQV